MQGDADEFAVVGQVLVEQLDRLGRDEVGLALPVDRGVTMNRCRSLGDRQSLRVRGDESGLPVLGPALGFPENAGDGPTGAFLPLGGEHGPADQRSQGAGRQFVVAATGVERGQVRELVRGTTGHLEPAGAQLDPGHVLAGVESDLLVGRLA